MRINKFPIFVFLFNNQSILSFPLLVFLVISKAFPQHIDQDMMDDRDHAERYAEASLPS